MRYAKPLLHFRSLRHLCLVLGCGLVLVAAVPHAPAPAKANKAAAPAAAAQTTTDHCATPTPTPTPAPGTTVPTPTPPPANICGKWGALVNLKTVPVHISLLPNGRLLYWGRDSAAEHTAGGDHWDVGNRSYTYTWDPSDMTGEGMTILNTTTNLFCSGHSFLPDGRLLVTGGHVRYTPSPMPSPTPTPAPWFNNIGETDVNIFDYRNNTWSLAKPMPRGRWYPSNVTLANGETVIASGTYWDGVTMTNGLPEIAVSDSIDLFTNSGVIRPFTRKSTDTIELYPYLTLAPDGRVFIAGAGPEPSRYFDPTAVNADGTTGEFTPGPDFAPSHLDGSAVVYDGVAGKVLMAGGLLGGVSETRQTVNSADTIDLTSATPVWKSSEASPPQVAPMKLGRSFHTATVLPDGKVLVTGGTQCSGGPAIDCMQDAQGNKVGAARRPELWTPPTEAAPDKWTLLAPSPEYLGYPVGIPRSYHSVAILLPDARVLVGGGGLPAAGGEKVANERICKDHYNRFGDLNHPDCVRFGHKDVEFFSPPYLFNADGSEVSEASGTRPVITSAPTSVIHGQSFTVWTNNAASISEVVLIRLPSVTHGFNFDQRRIVLNKEVTGSTSLRVTAPANGNVCPPGPYMLFVLSSNGEHLVPSKAKIISVQRYEGVIDRIACDQIRGWAWDSNQPNTPFNVTLNFSNFITTPGPQTPPVTLTANLFRQDLFNAGKGNGQHGFAFDVPLSMKDGKTRLLRGFIVGPEHALNWTGIGQLMCPASLFPTQIPTGTASGEGATWEQGTQFSSSVNGYISQIAFYKAEGETGTHYGRIWTDTGVPLTPPVQFMNETPGPGWQVQTLPSSVSITAGVKYRVTYNINSIVAKTFGGLNTPITNGPLTAHTSYYSTPAGTFPTTNSGSILFADIRFAQSLGAR